MKKIGLIGIMALSVLMLTNCKKESKNEGTSGTPTPKPTPTQNIVGIYFGGTWCGPCGAYGKPTKEQMAAEFGDKLTLISCQLNGQGAPDPMNNADANAFAATFGVTGVPILYLGGNNGLIQGVSGGTSMATTSIAKGNDIKALSPVATCSATSSLSGNDLTVNTEVNFQADQTEEYYLGVYLTESELNYTQYNDGSTHKNIHSHVLRKKVSASISGDLISANNKKGDTKTKQFTTTIDNSWNKDNMNISLVLWRKNSDGKITICNGFTKKLK